MKERNYLFDNLRALLIFLAVVGHMLTSQLGKLYSIDMVYYYIYFFHMPAFIFISGYFSKNVEKSRNTAVQSFFMPYLILNTLFWFKDSLLNVIDGKMAEPFRVFEPQWGMWFLFSMFVWKFILKDVIRIKYILPLSFIVGVLSGLSAEFSQKMSIGRIISFLPFFLLGYYFDEVHINKIRRIPKIISIFILSAFMIFAYYCNKYDIIKKELLFMRKPFNQVKNGMINDVYVRCLIYIIAIIMILCFINLLSTRNTWFSIIGQNSITVYVLHLLVVYHVRKLDLPWNGTRYFIIYALIISAIFTYLFSRPVIVKGYNYFINKISSLVLKPLGKVN